MIDHPPWSSGAVCCVGRAAAGESTHWDESQDFSDHYTQGMLGGATLGYEALAQETCVWDV